MYSDTRLGGACRLSSLNWIQLSRVATRCWRSKINKECCQTKGCKCSSCQLEGFVWARHDELDFSSTLWWLKLLGRFWNTQDQALRAFLWRKEGGKSGGVDVTHSVTCVQLVQRMWCHGYMISQEATSVTTQLVCKGESHYNGCKMSHIMSIIMISKRVGLKQIIIHMMIHSGTLAYTRTPYCMFKMEGFEGIDPSTLCGTVCQCLLWLPICITWPISLPIHGPL